MIRKKLLSSAMSENKQKRTEAEIVSEVCFVRTMLLNILDKAIEVKWPAR